MIGKIKKMLGIEGVKLSLSIDTKQIEEQGIIKGEILLNTLSKNTIQHIKIVLIERYERGRGSRQKIDEYEVAVTQLDDSFSMDANDTISIPFALEYALASSPIDKFGDRNFFFKGLSKLAKWRNKVKSSYRIEATARVEGTTLNPKDIYSFTED